MCGLLHFAPLGQARDVTEQWCDCQQSPLPLLYLYHYYPYSSFQILSRCLRSSYTKALPLFRLQLLPQLYLL